MLAAIDRIFLLGLLDWRTLFVGWRRGWVTRADVIGFTVKWLLKPSTKSDYRLSDLALGEIMTDQEVDDALSSYVAEQGPLPDERASAEVDKWRLAHLSLLADSALSFEATLDQLELLYSEFDYPEDMAECSRYYSSSVQSSLERRSKSGCPLEAMHIVVRELGHRFGLSDLWGVS